MRLAVILLLSSSLTACAAAPDRPPIARIAAMPAAVLIHDNFQTAVVLDGGASAALDDPQQTLRFHWELLDDESRPQGSLDAATVTASFRGDRPPRIVLTVTDPAGLTGDVTQAIALSIP